MGKIEAALLLLAQRYGMAGAENERLKLLSLIGFFHAETCFLAV